MTYRLLPAVSVPAWRMGVVVDGRVYHPETLYRRAKVDLSERQWPRALYKFEAVDLGAMALRPDERLSLGERVFVSDEALGLAFWATLTEVSRSLESPFEVSLSFETRPKKLAEVLEETVAGGVEESVFLPDPDGGNPGDQLILDENRNLVYGDSPSSHSHGNKDTLDAIPAPGVDGKILTSTGGGGMDWEDAPESHTHTNKATLDAIEDLSLGGELEVLTKVGSAAVWAATAATHSHANKTTLDKFTDAAFNGAVAGAYPYKVAGGTVAWMAPDNQLVWMGEVVSGSSSGGVQSYVIKLLSAVDRTPTGVQLSDCFVLDDGADPLVTGQRVAVVAPSAAGAAVGQKGFVVGRFGPDTSMPAHSHSRDRDGYLALFEA